LQKKSRLKKYILVLMAAVTLISCDTRRRDKIADDVSKLNEQAMKESTTVQVIDSTYNFGKVMDGEKVEYNYRFKNTGTKPLVIVKAEASCGCTVPQKPDRPILPGEIGFIKVVFDSKSRVGAVHKAVTITSNAKPEFMQLVLTGEVTAQK
jgi:Protein of unknown function (DUF1573)